jgi:hypothetical protein
MLTRPPVSWDLHYIIIVLFYNRKHFSYSSIIIIIIIIQSVDQARVKAL